MTLLHFPAAGSSYPQPIAEQEVEPERVLGRAHAVRQPKKSLGVVRAERINGVAFAIFTDPARPGFEYDPSIRSARQALEIARHVTGKSWITDAHLQQFAALMLEEFGEGATHG